MLKRFIAFLFILMIAGNVWAGVCGCLDVRDDHSSSCCKKDVSNHDAFSAKPCCEETCAPAGFSNLPRTQSESTIKIPLPTGTLAVEILPSFVLETPALDRAEIAVPFVDKRLNLARPPNLYLKHNSFRI